MGQLHADKEIGATQNYSTSVCGRHGSYSSIYLYLPRVYAGCGCHTHQMPPTTPYLVNTDFEAKGLPNIEIPDLTHQHFSDYRQRVKGDVVDKNKGR